MNNQQIADLTVRHLTYGMDVSPSDLEPTDQQLLWLANEYIIAKGKKNLRKWIAITVIIRIVLAVIAILALLNPSLLSGSEFLAVAGI